MSSRFSEVLDKMKTTYRNVADDHGPSEEEIREAFGTLVGAWDQVAESVTTALGDPETRDQLKAAAGSLASALGASLSQFGEEIEETPEEEE